MNPKGNHMNIANVAIGLGLKANLSSWKINGLDISSLAGFKVSVVKNKLVLYQHRIENLC